MTVPIDKISKIFQNCKINKKFEIYIQIFLPFQKS